LPAQTLVIAPPTGPANLSRLASERIIDAA
jgi:hypothetical protein